MHGIQIVIVLGSLMPIITQALHTSYMIYNVFMLWFVFYHFTNLNIKLVPEWSISTYRALMQVLKIHTHVHTHTRIPKMATEGCEKLIP